MKTLFNFSVLALILSVYYLAMHITGGILTSADIIVCSAVILFCLISIARYIYRQYIKNE